MQVAVDEISPLDDSFVIGDSVPPASAPSCTAQCPPCSPVPALAAPLADRPLCVFPFSTTVSVQALRLDLWPARYLLGRALAAWGACRSVVAAGRPDDTVLS